MQSLCKAVRVVSEWVLGARRVQRIVRFVVLTLVLGLFVVPAAADRSPRKPSAPVDVRVESTAIAGGYQVRLVAIPTRDVPALELTLAGKQLSFGPTAAGQRRELVTTVSVRAGEGLDVVGAARAGGRNRVELVRVGKAQQRAAKPATVYTLGDGRQIREAR